MKHIYILLTLLILSSCAAKFTQPGSFTIKVSEVTATKALITIEASNQEAYYVYGLVREDMEYYNYTDEELAQFQLDFASELLGYALEDDPSATFADRFCYKGSLSDRRYYLQENTKYKLNLFQVNPVTRERIGPVLTEFFQTEPLVKSDIQFDIQFGADKITITPSNDDIYYWDYENTDLIKEEFIDPEFYYTDLVHMYETYGFMSSMTSRGYEEYIFSEDPLANVEEGEKCTFVIAAYNNDEINSDLITIEFVYHKDEPCQVIPPKQT